MAKQTRTPKGEEQAPETEADAPAKVEGPSAAAASPTATELEVAAESAGDPEDRVFTTARLTENSRTILGVPRHTAAGAFHGKSTDEELSVAAARRLVERYVNGEEK